MRKQVIIAVTVGVLCLGFASTIHAKDTNTKKHQPIYATDVEIIKKETYSGKGSIVSPSTKVPTKEPVTYATGNLSNPATGARYAIIIGMADYIGDDMDLKYTINDANAMKYALETVYDFPPENIIFLQNKFATRNAVLDEIDRIGGFATSGTEVIFFYSGHGGTGIASDGDSERVDESIILYDDDNLWDGHLWDGELVGAFSNYKTTNITFIFDSCAAGGMNDLADTGRIVNMASIEKGDNTSVELSDLTYDVDIDGDGSTEVGFGEFTYYLVVEGMLQKLADTTTNNNIVSVEEAYDYAKENTYYDTPTITDELTELDRQL